MASRATVTQLLCEWRAGDDAALQSLTPLVYDELRSMAQRYMARERADHTLQATALVHEAFAQLTEADVEPVDRSHFLALSARLMRRILVDHARAKKSAKRGGGVPPLSLDDVQIAGDSREQILALEAAIEKLSTVDSRRSDILVLHYFGGMTYDEIAVAVGVSAATVDRQLRLAKAWLLSEFQDD
jgi:RNA polymerase sigma factor (TIGR02999 family)